MVDLNKLSPAALKAAVIGGTEGWGQHASIKGARYCEKAPSRSRRRCSCCKKRATHQGRVNGISLITACEMQVMLWVKDPEAAFASRRRLRASPAPDTEGGEG